MVVVRSLRMALSYTSGDETNTQYVSVIQPSSVSADTCPSPPAHRDTAQAQQQQQTPGSQRLAGDTDSQAGMASVLRYLYTGHLPMQHTDLCQVTLLFCSSDVTVDSS